MNNYIQLTDTQKRAVLTQCKNMIGLPEQAVEKDYWVTVMLQLIFISKSHCRPEEQLPTNKNFPIFAPELHRKQRS